jgi:2-hydroxy-6-oxonona-2,4-dienedioate hydrolase
VSIRHEIVALHGRSVHYMEAGHGAPVILCAGLGLSGHFYSANMEAFGAAGLRLIVPDAPGFGRTHGPWLGGTVQDNARWLTEFACAIGVRRAALIGHSIGAQVALRIAVDSPHLASALVLAGPSGAPGRFKLLRQALGIVITTPREPFSLLVAVARDYIRTSPVRYIATWAKAARDDPFDSAARVRCPTLIVAGKRDPIARAEFVALLKQRIAGSLVCIVPGGAHGITFDRTREFDRVVCEFLRECV